MNFLNKFVVLTLALMLLLSFAGCNSDKNPADNSSSKPQTSTPSDSEESKPESETSKPVEDNSSTDSTPVVSNSQLTNNESKPDNKKTAKELLIGKWKTEIDIIELLNNAGYEISVPVIVTVVSEFKTDGTFNDSIDDAQFKAILQNAYGDAYVDDIYDTFKDDFKGSGKYKFDGDVLSTQYEGDPDFYVVEYEFKDDNNFYIVTPSEEINYTRVS